MPSQAGDSATSVNRRGRPLGRRSFIQAAGAAGIVGLAGCSGDGGDGSNGDGSSGDGGNTGGGGSGLSLHIGILAPTSGAFSGTGESQANGIRLGANEAVEEGLINDVEFSVADTQTDPNAARTRAQEMINDGADMLSGTIQSAVGLSVSELADRSDVPFTTNGGTNAITGAECRPSTFAWSSNAVTQLGASLGYVMANDIPSGTDMYMISADYAYGQNLAQYVQNNLVDRYDLNIVGSDFVPLEASDYSSQITNARNQDPDVMMMNIPGPPQVTSLTQVEEYGLLDSATVVYPTTDLATGISYPPELISHENYYSSLDFYWNHSYSDAGDEFVAAYQEEYPDSRISPFTPAHYAGVKTAIQAMAEVGSKALGDMRGAYEGREIYPDLWGINGEMRACDHRAELASSAVQGKPESERESELDVFEVVNVPSLETVREMMRSCEETGCSMPPA